MTDITTRPSAGRSLTGDPAGTGSGPIGELWRRGRTAMAVAVGLAVVVGLLSGWLMPRGPVTTGQALMSIAAGLGVGLLAGIATGSRWSLLLVPAAFAAAVELVRMGAVGPTVDAPDVGSLIALLPFVLGRTVHGLLALVPMVLGGLYGIALATRRGHPSATPLRWPGWAMTAALTVAVAALAVLIARPASTPPILGPDGEPLPGSIAELVTTEIGGHPQALMIRGQRTDAPVLLHLAGGPGGTDIGAMRLDTGLEAHFVVVTWDQRGTGKSYPAFDPAETMTPDQVVADTLAVTDYLRDRFDQDRIYLTGQSWGTLPSVLAVQQHPERYHAFIGTGQMVSVRETDQIFYQETLAWARQEGDDALVARLEAMGQPPYADVVGDYPVLVGAERSIYPYPEFDGRTEMPATVWVPENSLMDQINAFRGLADTYATVYPQLQAIDLRTEVPRLDVPVYLLVGRHEARGRVQPAQEWFAMLEAPDKQWIEFEGSSHRASFERPADYVDLLTRVLEETQGRAS